MKALIKIIICLALFLSQNAMAASAQELLSACRPVAKSETIGGNVRLDTKFETGVCWGEFDAIQRVTTIPDKTNRRTILDICAPSNSTRVQLIAIFVNYAEKNPQRLHLHGFDIAVESLQAAFPCKSKE